jgi:hypothetical protein
MAGASFRILSSFAIVLYTLLGTEISASAVDSRATYKSQQSDSMSLSSDDDVVIEPVDDASPGMLFLILIAIGAILICLGVGIAVTFLCALVLAGLISFGILSTSIVVGLHQKSFTQGFKVFIVLTASITSTLFGGSVLWIVNRYFYWFSDTNAFFSGSLIGLIGGLLLGFVAFYIIQQLTLYLKKQFNL